MNAQFLRAEAARFREMADGVTDREASKQRLLNMALDYEARANAADAAQPTGPKPEPEAEPEPQPPSAPVTSEPVKLRISKRTPFRG